ncbi:MAG: DEAD/DEAH box helicase [Nocardioidaceae bacterium]|nr:DEAD/DEAH box helicase [Nocardioidaceae bacterium]
MPADPIETLLRLGEVPGREGRLRHLTHVPARPAVHAAWPEWADERVVAALRSRGVTRPWAHQAEAADLAWSGEHVVLSTGTASGKSLAYQLPALTTLLAGRTGGLFDRGPTVLYLAPTKALAHDQAAGLRDLLEGLEHANAVRVAPVDGDNSREERQWARDHANYVVTNPDLLHRTVLPGHERWGRLLRGLRYVVVDECHHYRGVFGSHVAHVLRRLRRVAAHHGADPVFVLASATQAEPRATAERLTGLSVRAVEHDGSPRGPTAIALWEPPLTEGGGENDAPVRRPATTEAAELLADLVVAGVRTLAFVRSRRGSEQVALSASRYVAEVDQDLSRRIQAYRGGYLPEDRRAIESAFRDGSLVGLASTNALELGIDIAGLDAVLSAGFPGTRAALWQQFGRAGRTGGEALGVFVARDDPLDTYLVAHPEALIGAPLETTVLDPSNPYVIGPHLAAAAQEVPLVEADLDLFGPGAREGVDALTEAGWLRRRPKGWFWTRRERASDLADIRSSGGSPVQIVDARTGRLIGTVDAASAHSGVHTGAVHLHRGELYVVEDFDHVDGVAAVRRDDPDYTTTAREVTDVQVVVELESGPIGDVGTLSFGTVDVTSQVVAYLRRRVGSGEVLGEEPLDLPARTLRTSAVWWTIPDDVLAADGWSGTDLPGAAHAAEHASIGLMPLLAVCDRWDIGGLSTAHHPDTGTLTVFVHDGHPGGAGFARRGYEQAEHWLGTTLEAIRACPCVEGCPSCVQSPKCGNGNQPLSKSGAVALLSRLLTRGDPPVG